MRRCGSFARRHVSAQLLDADLSETIRRARVDAECASQIALDSSGLSRMHTPLYRMAHEAAQASARLAALGFRHVGGAADPVGAAGQAGPVRRLD